MRVCAWVTEIYLPFQVTAAAAAAKARAARTAALAKAITYVCNFSTYSDISQMEIEASYMAVEPGDCVMFSKRTLHVSGIPHQHRIADTIAARMPLLRARPHVAAGSQTCTEGERRWHGMVCA